MMLSRYDVSLEGPLRLKLGPGSIPILNKPEITENRHLTEVISPWVFGFGANWDITPWLEVGGEFRYYLTSLVKEQRTTITEGEFLKLMLPNGIVTPKNSHNQIHTGGGFIVKPPLRFRNAPIPIELMTGFHYESTSAPDRTVEVSAPSFNLIAYHIGARWEPSARLRVTLAYSHYWYLERTTQNSITSPPTNFTGSAYTNSISLVVEGRFARGIGTGN
jgi:hypothetical protein